MLASILCPLGDALEQGHSLTIRVALTLHFMCEYSKYSWPFSVTVGPMETIICVLFKAGRLS